MKIKKIMETIIIIMKKTIIKTIIKKMMKAIRIKKIKMMDRAGMNEGILKVAGVLWKCSS